MEKPFNVLMLEDSETDAEIVQQVVRGEFGNCRFLLAMNKEAFILALEDFVPSVILADNSLPQFDAAEALQIARKMDPQIPFILVTGTVSEEFAAEIIKAGADDYILKDRLTRLPTAIEAAIKKHVREIERYAALEEIKRSNERFQTLSKATKDAVWDWNLLTDEVWWNEHFFHLLGYDPNLPIPPVSEWAERIHYKDRGKVMQRLKNIRQSAVDSWEDEYRFLLADGSYGLLLERTYIVKDQEGIPARAIGALVDITEQSRLRAEMEVLSLIAKETTNSVMIFDRDNGRLTWVNEGLTRSTGYGPEEMYARNPWSVLAGRKGESETVKFINRQIRENVPFSRELEIYTKAGEKRCHFLNGQPMGENKWGTAHYFIIGADITDLRRIEEERLSNKVERQKEITRVMLQGQEMERNALGRELHDNINQILASINLRLGYYLEEPENNIDIVADCRQKLLLAMKETRDLSHHMVMPRFSERKLKDELEMLIENDSFSKKVELQMTGIDEEQIPSSIKENIYRIAQEQLTNILKHSHASHIRMRLRSDKADITMEIRDDGVGFDPQEKRKGIGLTNILNRVESYNGTADIITAKGMGCLLVVKIPIQ